MAAATVPVPAILNHVIQYFKNAFPNSPPAAFVADLEIRKAFKARTWKALADAINVSTWMQKMNKSITQQQMADPKVKTIFDVALLITNTTGTAVQLLAGTTSFPLKHDMLKNKGMKALNI